MVDGDIGLRIEGMYLVVMNELRWGRGGITDDRLSVLDLACGLVPNFQLEKNDEDLGLVMGEVLTTFDRGLILMAQRWDLGCNNNHATGVFSSLFLSLRGSLTGRQLLAR